MVLIESRMHKQHAILTEFPRLVFKDQLKARLCSVIRRKPATSFDNVLRDFGNRYIEGFTAPSFADLFANAPFSESLVSGKVLC